MTGDVFFKLDLSLSAELSSFQIFTRLKKYSQHPDFTPEKVGTVSVACKSMCQWVLAIEHYYFVDKMAKPKQQRVEEAKEALKLAKERLAHKQSSLRKVSSFPGLWQAECCVVVCFCSLLENRWYVQYDFGIRVLVCTLSCSILCIDSGSS